MADRAIQVAVLEGYFATICTLGFPMPLSLQLQQSDLRLNWAMWSAKSSGTGFSVSFVWPVTYPCKHFLSEKFEEEEEEKEEQEESKGWQ